MSVYTDSLAPQICACTFRLRVQWCDFTVFKYLLHAEVFSFLFSASAVCSHDSILQTDHFMGVSTSCVFCLSNDIETSSTTPICGLLSNLFDVSLYSSLSLAPLLPVLLSSSLPDAFALLLCS